MAGGLGKSLAPKELSPDLREFNKRLNRVRSGCFSCRKRKKKCDETQPYCVACTRNGYKCEYPENNETLPVDFKLEKATYELTRKRKSSFLGPETIQSPKHQQFFNVLILDKPPTKSRTVRPLRGVGVSSKNNFEKLKIRHSVNDGKNKSRRTSRTNTEHDGHPEELLEVSSSSHLVLNSPIELSETIDDSEKKGPYIIESPEESIEETPMLFLYDLKTPNSTTDVSTKSSPFKPANPWLETVFTSSSSYLPHMTLLPQDSEFFHHFISDFLPSIKLPHSHPLLSPELVYVQLAAQSEIITEVYLCCGASFLAFHHANTTDGSLEVCRRLSSLAESKYRNAVMLLGDAIKNRKVDIDSDWLFAAGLMLLLRDRSYAKNGSRCCKHLMFIYQLLKRRLDKKEDETVPGQELFLYTNITATERSLFDSFVFNYSAILLSCSKQDLISLPSPYDVFPNLKQWMNHPIYKDCNTNWMNNPVLGSAFDSYEILSKLSWLLRFHFNREAEPSMYDIDDAEFWDLIIPLRAEIAATSRKISSFRQQVEVLQSTLPKATFAALRSNVSVATITVEACKILMEKLVNPTIPSFLSIIQDALRTIFQELHHIPPENHSNCLITVSLFLAGISTTTQTQRTTFEERLGEISKSLASNVGHNLISVLKFGWDKEDHDKDILHMGDRGFRCFDLVFDRPSLEQITF